VADVHVERVVGIELEGGKFEVVLIVANACALNVAIVVDEMGVKGIGAQDVGWLGVLTGNEREPHERIGAVDAEPNLFTVGAVVLDGINAERERVALLPTRKGGGFVVAVYDFTVAAGKYQCNRK